MKLKEVIRTPEGDLMYEESEILRKSQKFKNRNFSKIKPWSVFWGAVHFSDDPRFFKIRPIIILNIEGDIAKVLICSSVEKPDRYLLKNYLNLGLIKPTYVVKRVISLKSLYILDSLKGTLSKKDEENLSSENF